VLAARQNWVVQASGLLAAAAIAVGVATGGLALLAAAGLAGTTLVLGLSVTSLRRTGADRVEAMPILRLSVGLLWIGVLLVTFNGVRAGPGLSVADVALMAAALCVLVHCSLTHSRIVVPVWLLVSAGGILASGLLSSTSNELSENLVPAARFAVALALTPTLIATLTVRAGARRMIVGAWLLSASVAALVGLSDFLGVTHIGLSVLPDNTSGRVNGLTAHPNHLGLVCAMAMPVALWGVITDRQARPFSRGLHLVILPLLIGGILVSGSRAAIVAGVAGILLVPVLLGRRGRRAAVMVAFVGAAVAVALIASTGGDESTGGSTTVFERFGDQSDLQASDSGRLLSFERALSTFESNPLFGGGFVHVRAAHDIYLQLLQAGGLLALVSFTVFVVGTMRTGASVRRRLRALGSGDDLAAALIASMVVWLVAGLVQPAIYDRYLYLPAGLLFGMAAAIGVAPRRNRDPLAEDAVSETTEPASGSSEPLLNSEIGARARRRHLQRPE
jgi:O-antigen ligase